MKIGQYVIAIRTTTVKGYLGIDIGWINRGWAIGFGVLIGGVTFLIQHHEAYEATKWFQG